MHSSPGIAQLDQQLEKPPTAERVLTRSKVHVARLLIMPGQLAEGSAAGRASLNGGAANDTVSFVHKVACSMRGYLHACACTHAVMLECMSAHACVSFFFEYACVYA